MQVIESARPLLEAVSPLNADSPYAAKKWTRKQMLGHLIDSASNNHQRFVRGPLQDNMVFPGYDQVAWVENQDYINSDWSDLIQLWYLYNEHLAHVMEMMPEKTRLKEHAEHSLDQVAYKTVDKDKPVSLDYFMRDYVGHLEHHLGQILADYQQINPEYSI